jgi:Na+/H+-dicarboxylate symporter
VLIAIAIGVVLGYVAPETAKSVKWLGDAFINLTGVSSSSGCAPPTAAV